MKRLSAIFMAGCLGLGLCLGAGCYMIQNQSLDDIKGTYKLTTYETTDKNVGENKETVVVDQIEAKGLEVYLVVTGEDKGWYVYKSSTVEAYAVEVEMSYEADEEEADTYNYIYYQFSTEKEAEKLGVARNGLNKERPAILHQQGWDINWSKEDDATDLSYVREQLGEMPQYTYEGWAKFGGYHVTWSDTTTPQGETRQTPYQYYYVLLDSYTMKATTYYSDGLSQVKKGEDITLVDGWNTIRFGTMEWTFDGYHYTATAVLDEITYELRANKYYSGLDAEQLIEDYIERNHTIA